jgi:hypothetical protein
MSITQNGRKLIGTGTLNAGGCRGVIGRVSGTVTGSSVSAKGSYSCQGERYSFKIKATVMNGQLVSGAYGQKDYWGDWVDFGQFIAEKR